MRLRLTDKDLVLIAGIVVAAIIALTTLWLDSTPRNEKVEQAKPKANVPSASVLVNKIGKGFMPRWAQ